MAMFKVKCDLCDTCINFAKKPAIQELKWWGFYYWGTSSDGQYYCTCDSCTTEVNSLLNKGPENEEIHKGTMTIYDLHSAPREIYMSDDNPFLQSFEETAREVQNALKESNPKILYREI